MIPDLNDQRYAVSSITRKGSAGFREHQTESWNCKGGIYTTKRLLDPRRMPASSRPTVSVGGGDGGVGVRQGGAETGNPGRRAISSHPGDVRINVQGAFIVESNPQARDEASDGVHYERKDIRLPHHTAVVSHVAVDVGKLQ